MTSDQGAGNRGQTVHLIEGPVGAGKTTYARAMSTREHLPFLCLDDWFARLFIPDRPGAAGVEWYLDRKSRCLDLIWDVATNILDAGNDVILELGLVVHSDREAFYSRVDAVNHRLRVYLLDASEDVRRERVRRRNLEHGETWSVDLTDEMFERVNRWWEPPDDAEYRARWLVDVSST